jgi:quercetin dioxygenase-like cupin family protein
MFRTLFAAAILAVAVTSGALATEPQLGSVKLVYDHPLPNVPGKSMRGVLVEYAPRGSSPAHTHPKTAFIYATVLEGAIQSQVNGGPVETFRAGESFSENPGDRHGVSRNASRTERARLLADFVVDTADTVLTTDDR